MGLAGPRLRQRGAAANEARGQAARLIGADPDDVALIPSVSSAAGLVAAQLGAAAPGENVVIGEREYSSNHFPWRQLEHKGYDVRQVPFRRAGLDPEQVDRRVDGGTRVVAFSAVQSSTGHRSDIAAISSLARQVGAIVFVDGSQMVGAVPVPRTSATWTCWRWRTTSSCSMRAGGWATASCPGRCRSSSPRSTRAGARAPTPSPASSAPRWSCHRPRHVSTAPSAGSRRSATSPPSASSTTSAPTSSPARNRDLEARLRGALTGAGWEPIALPAENRSTIVPVPLGGLDPARVVRALSEERVIASARDGALRLSVHLYNHEDDIDRLVAALGSLGRPPAQRMTRSSGSVSGSRTRWSRGSATEVAEGGEQGRLRPGRRDSRRGSPPVVTPSLSSGSR